jgi:hypothetical protein
MRRSPSTHTSRRRHAVLALLVWLLGVEVLPDLHLATHAWLPAHHHDGDAPPSDELVVTVHGDRTAAALHAHDGSVHGHGVAARATVPDRDAIHREDPARHPGHGQHSAAHRALALLAPAPVLHQPLPVDHHVIPVSHAVARLVAIAPPPDAGARGPPA